MGFTTGSWPSAGSRASGRRSRVETRGAWRSSSFAQAPVGVQIVDFGDAGELAAKLGPAVEGVDACLFALGILENAEMRALAERRAA